MEQSSGSQYITIKGTKQGLTIFLDDQCDFTELMKGLEEKISNEQQLVNDGPKVSVKVNAGYRYIKEEQEREISKVLSKTATIEMKELESYVMTKEEAKRVREEASITSFSSIVRSGQVLRAKGDIILLGDINPGGTVEATGDIYVLGALKGIARAGIDGKKDAVICASIMRPKQISISDKYYHAPERHEQQEDLLSEPLYAYYEQEKDGILFEKMKVLTYYTSRRDKKTADVK